MNDRDDRRARRARCVRTCDATALPQRRELVESSSMKERARDLGVSFEGTPGPLNAITDVGGVAVGYSTIIEGAGVRTGVTAILPRGKDVNDPVFSGWFPLNGNGEMTGTTWIEESGFLEGPIMLTNTHSVGVVRDAVVAWQVKMGRLFQPFSYPIVAETYDGQLNDINGFHVRAEHAVAAIEAAKGGAIAEGNVGGGTGMVCFQFKGGTGTASRVTSDDGGESFTVGALVQANFGLRHQLTIAGVPVGKAIPKVAEGAPAREQGSIIVVVATDAPLLPHQLKRLARRAAMGLARTGSCAGNGSGDIMIALSTANPGAASQESAATVQMLPNARITQLFDATVFATEEAIINALVAAETMTGYQNRMVEALPHDRVRALLRRWA
jgi:L-aminopeptidase/D-esterase-like protein